jgi:beta-phosphoglucomutase-like phosphatase (HAD superfamily)
MLQTITSQWQRALDSTERALDAAPGGSSHPPDLARYRGELVLERQQIPRLLAHVAHDLGVWPVPWLSPMQVDTKMLGLADTVCACLFDLDGVLTNSALLHAWSWGEVFDDLMVRLSEKTGWHVIPFDRDADYRDFLEGRPRLEGVHAFLASRGIRLPEGDVGDAPNAETANGLARRKGEVLARRLHQRGVVALPGARRYLEAAGHAGLKRAVVSASTSTLPMLELAGLATLVDAHVDGDLIRAEGLRSRPAPDVLLVACRDLHVQAEQAVTFTQSVAGVAAGHAAGLAVIGVGDGAKAELLRGFGAKRVIPSVNAVLDSRLSDSRNDLAS